MLNLLFANLPQLIDLRSTPRHGPLYNLESPSQHCARLDCVRRRLRIHLDHADPRILGPAVVLAIFQIAEPCLQGRGVVLADGVSVRDDVSFARNGGPFTGRVKEGNVDLGIGFQVVGFAGLGVGVEEKVEAATLLERSFKISS